MPRKLAARSIPGQLPLELTEGSSITPPTAVSLMLDMMREAVNRRAPQPYVAEMDRLLADRLFEQQRAYYMGHQWSQFRVVSHNYGAYVPVRADSGQQMTVTGRHPRRPTFQREPGPATRALFNAWRDYQTELDIDRSMREMRYHENINAQIEALSHMDYSAICSPLPPAVSAAIDAAVLRGDWPSSPEQDRTVTTIEESTPGGVTPTPDPDTTRSKS